MKTLVSASVAFALLLVASCSNGSGGSSAGSATQAPQAAFTATVTSGALPLVVAFEQTTAGGTTSWSWDFGDGTTCTGVKNADGTVTTDCSPLPQVPTHTYQTVGTYSVTLVATGPFGTQTEHKDGYITVLPHPPLANFTSSDTTGVIPFTSQFHNTSTDATDYVWDFGDSTPTSTDTDPIHTYTTYGDYTVTLTANGPGGTDVHAATALVHAMAPLPSPDFVLQVGSGRFVPNVSSALPFTVRYIQPDAQYTTTWQWDFDGDGSVDSTSEAPMHTFAQPGLFSPHLHVEGPGGVNDSQLLDAVEAFDDIDNANFEQQAGGEEPGSGWTSTVGNAGGPTGNVIRPSGAALTDAGFPTTPSRWCEISTQSTNSPTPPGPTTGSIGAAGITQTFSYRTGLTRLKMDVEFVTGEPLSSGFLDWMDVEVSDFTTSRLIYLKHSTDIPATLFSAIHPEARASGITTISADLPALFPGSTVSTLFQIAVRVGNGGNGLNTSWGYIDNVRLENPLTPITASFTTDLTNANVNQAVTFTSTSTGNPTLLTWDFGDGTAATGAIVTHAFATAGAKTVRLSASSAGASDFHDGTGIIVYAAPNASFSVNAMSGVSPFTVIIANTSHNAHGVVYTWAFGDGSPNFTGTTPPPHTYINTGSTNVTHNIRMTASTPTTPAQTHGFQITITVQHP